MIQHNDNLIKVLGIERLPDDQKLRILEAATNLVEQNLMLRLYDVLPEPKRDELNQKLEANDPQSLNEFINKEVPNFSEWVVEETTKVKDELDSFVQSQD
jgi:hypothetical protein